MEEILFKYLDTLQNGENDIQILFKMEEMLFKYSSKWMRCRKTLIAFSLNILKCIKHLIVFFYFSSLRGFLKITEE